MIAKLSAAAALAALISLSACWRGAPEKEEAGAVPNNLVLRSYEVPNNGAKQVQSLLAEVLWFGSEGKDSNRVIGRSDVGPDGRLVVMATPGVQEGVKELIDSLAKNPVKPAPAPAITFDYWFVLGAPGKEAAAANLQELAPALAEIARSDGPQQFTLAEKLTLTSSSGERAEVTGRDAHIGQVIAMTSQGIHAEVNLHRFAQGLQTKLNLASGQIVVLGSAGAGSFHEKDENGSTIYFLIRAVAHDGQGR